MSIGRGTADGSTWKPAGLACIAAMAAAGVAYADDSDNSSGDNSTIDPWAARAQAGYSKTGGTTDTSSANALFHVAHVMGDWKLLFGLDGLYGSTRGETTAQAWDTYFQSNYNFTPRLFWYGALRYDDNKFSGFAYQATAATGMGYQFIKTDATKLTGQLGVGARRLQPEELTLNAVGGIVSSTTLPEMTDAVLDAAVNYEHDFNQYTKVIAQAAVEYGKDNTMTSAGLALQVKMSRTLSLAAGYQVVHNSHPPAGVSTSSSLTTLNLVYEHKNKKLAPEP
jgi:putative salt-induced outer membrane protein